MPRAATKPVVIERIELVEALIENTDARLTNGLAAASVSDRKNRQSASKELAAFAEICARLERAKQLQEELYSLDTQKAQLEWGLWYWSLPWWKRVIKRMRRRHAPRREA
jgi:hypothetical protein